MGKLCNNENILKVKNLKKVYIDGQSERTVLNDINLNIKKGSINVITGESGCGKTTFISIMEGIDKPSEGEIVYQDKHFYELSKQEQAQIRGEKFGIIFQDFNLIDELTVKDNILLPTRINKKRVDVELYEDLIKILKLNKRENNYPNELSGGEQQRVAIARAMIMWPDIIFADEPTGNLDEKNSKIVKNTLLNVNQKYKKTIIIATHDMSFCDIADNIISITNGNIFVK